MEMNSRNSIETCNSRNFLPFQMMKNVEIKIMMTIQIPPMQIRIPLRRPKITEM
jgi:hypothetical protein